MPVVSDTSAPQVPSPEPTEVPTNPAQYDLSNADAIALVEYVPGTSYIDGQDALIELLAGSTEPQVVLAKVDFFGRLIYAGHPAAAGPKAIGLRSIAPNGHLVTFNAAKGISNVAVISNSWTEITLAEEGATDAAPFLMRNFEYSERQVLRLVGENGHLAVINPSDSQSSLDNDPAILKQDIPAKFAISTLEGDIFVEAADGKVFHLKTDSQLTGFVKETAMPTIAGGVSVGIRAYVGGRSYRVSEDEIFYSLVPQPVIRTAKPGLLAGAWGIAGDSQTFAVNLLAGKMASNPLAPENGVLSPRIESATGLVFDGFNLATISASPTRAAVVQFGKIAYRESSNLKVLRIFGADHGFSEKFFAFASDGESLFWTSIDKTTGVLDSATAVVWNLDAGMGTVDEFVASSSAYKVGDKVVLLRRATGTGLVEAQFPPAGGALTLRVIDGSIDKVMRHDLGLIESSNTLLFTTGDDDKIYSYDAGTDSIALRAQPILATLTNETVCTRRILGIVPKGTGHVPGLIVRFCPGNEILALVPFADETFVAPGLPIDLGLPKAAAVEPGESLPILRDQSGQILINDVGKEVITVSSDMTALLYRLNPDAVLTEGMFSLSRGFDADQPGKLKVFPWVGTKAIVNGKIGGQYRTQIVDLASRSVTPLPDLDDLAIEQAGQGRSKRMIIDALNAANERVMVRFETNDTVSGVDKFYRVSFVDIEPL